GRDQSPPRQPRRSALPRLRCSGGGSGATHRAAGASPEKDWRCPAPAASLPSADELPSCRVTLVRRRRRQSGRRGAAPAERFESLKSFVGEGVPPEHPAATLLEMQTSA